MQTSYSHHRPENARSQPPCAIALATALAFCGVASDASAASQTWDGSVSSAWTTGGNWVGNQAPGGDINTLNIADIASFSTAALAPGGSTTVNAVHAPTLLGGISITGSTPFSFAGADFYLTDTDAVFVSSSSANQTFSQMVSSYQSNGSNQNMRLVNDGAGMVVFGTLMKDVQLSESPYTSTDGGDIVFDGVGDFTVSNLQKRREGMTADLVKQGDGTLSLTGFAGSFGNDPDSEAQSGLTGITTIQGGAVRITSGDQRSLGQPQTAQAGWITLNGGALRVSTVDLVIDHANAGVTVTGIGGAFQVDTNRTLTIGGGGGANILSGDADFAKVGGGRMVLNGDHTYEAGISLDEGSLIVNGSLAPYQINAAVGTTLGGVGSISGTVIVAGTLAPGNGGVGTLSTVGDVQLSGTFHCDIGGAEADQLVVNGTLSLENLTLVVDENQTPTSSIYVIATYTGDYFGTGFSSVPEGYTIDTVSVPNQVILLRENTVPTAFDDWVDDFELSGFGLLVTSDPDNDGVINLLEFILDGDPSAVDPTSLPQQSISDGNLVLTFDRRDDSEDFATLVLQYSPDLASWTDITIGAENGSSGGVSWTVAENDGAADFITVSIPIGDFTSQFARLQATVNP